MRINWYLIIILTILGCSVFEPNRALIFLEFIAITVYFRDNDLKQQEKIVEQEQNQKRTDETVKRFQGALKICSDQIKALNKKSAKLEDDLLMKERKILHPPQAKKKYERVYNASAWNEVRPKRQSAPKPPAPTPQPTEKQ